MPVAAIAASSVIQLEQPRVPLETSTACKRRGFASGDCHGKTGAFPPRWGEFARCPPRPCWFGSRSRLFGDLPEDAPVTIRAGETPNLHADIPGRTAEPIERKHVRFVSAQVRYASSLPANLADVGPPLINTNDPTSFPEEVHFNLPYQSR